MNKPLEEIQRLISECVAPIVAKRDRLRSENEQHKQAFEPFDGWERDMTRRVAALERANKNRDDRVSALADAIDALAKMIGDDSGFQKRIAAVEETARRVSERSHRLAHEWNKVKGGGG